MKSIVAWLRRSVVVVGSSLPLGLETSYLRGSMVLFVVMLLGRRSILVSTPCDNGYVAAETLSGGENYQMQSYRSIRCLLFQTSTIPIPGGNHTGIIVIALGGPAATSKGDVIGSIVISGAEGPPVQRMPRIMRLLVLGVL